MAVKITNKAIVYTAEIEMDETDIQAKMDEYWNLHSEEIIAKYRKAHKKKKKSFFADPAKTREYLEKKLGLTNIYNSVYVSLVKDQVKLDVGKPVLLVVNLDIEGSTLISDFYFYPELSVDMEKLKPEVSVYNPSVAFDTYKESVYTEMSEEDIKANYDSLVEEEIKATIYNHVIRLIVTNASFDPVPEIFVKRAQDSFVQMSQNITEESKADFNDQIIHNMMVNMSKNWYIKQYDLEDDFEILIDHMKNNELFFIKES
jgi:hypothetical protein